MSYSILIRLKEEPEKTEITIPKDVPAEIIQLEVLNGCGVPGLADRFTDYLRSKNFDVVNSDNYMSFDIDKSMVIDRIGNKANALKVADALGIKSADIITQINEDYFLDVSVIIGRDYHNLTPLK